MSFVVGAFKKAKGRGLYKAIYEEYSDLGTVSGLYATGGVTHTVDDLTTVKAVIPQVESGALMMEVVSKSSNAYKLLLRDIVGGSGSNYQEVANNTKISGVYSVQALVLGE